MAKTIDSSGGREAILQRWKLLTVSFLVSLYLYLRLFFSFNIPYFFAADQTFFWQYALRMLHGERVYRDFFQFTPPGLDLYFLLLFRVFGSQVWVANLGAILLGVALCITCFALASKFMNQSEALLTASFFVIFAYGGHLDVTHHWFSLLASLGATAALMRNRTEGRVFIAGTLLAVASFFTQTAGVASTIGLLLSLAWEHEYGMSWRTIMRNQAILLLSFAGTWLALSAYFLASAGWSNLWYFQVTYAWDYVDTTRGFLIPKFRGANAISLLQRLFLYLLLILEYPLVLWHCWRRRRERSPKDMEVVLLAMTGLFLFLGIITRSNWSRLYGVSMPAIILFMKSVMGIKYERRRSAMAVICCGVVCLAAMQVRGTRHQKSVVMELPGGRMAVPQMDAEEFRWLQQHTRPGDDVFQATWTSIYLPLDLRSPVFVETLLPDRTPPEFISLAVRQVQQGQVKYILWSPWLQPDSRQESLDSLQPFRAYMENHYVRINVFPNRDEIWERI